MHKSRILAIFLDLLWFFWIVFNFLVAPFVEIESIKENFEILELLLVSPYF